MHACHNVYAEERAEGEGESISRRLSVERGAGHVGLDLSMKRS